MRSTTRTASPTSSLLDQGGGDRRSTWLDAAVGSLAVAIVLAAVGCGSSSGKQAMTVDGPPTGGGGPIFLSFGTNVTALDKSAPLESQSVTFSAVLTTPEGDDLVGGTLTDESGSIQYGAFQSGTEKGSFSLTISWNDINQTKPLTFVNMDSRVFVAQFFDAKGAKSSKSATIAFTCGGVSACDGSCFDLQTDAANCGSCGTVCENKPGVANRGCHTGVCNYVTGSAAAATCDDVCGAVGLTCSASCPGTSDNGAPLTWAMTYYSHGNFYSTSCTETPPLPCMPPDCGDELCCCK
jgi:hypothetical protein